MASVNKVILLGNLGKDPEFRMTPQGSPVVNFSLATNEAWKDKAGEKKTKTEWHNIVMWGRPAELANQYLKKGSAVYLEGKLQTRVWEDKEGGKRYTTEIVCHTMQFIGAAPGRDSDMGQEDEAAEPAGRASHTKDDLPF